MKKLFNLIIGMAFLIMASVLVKNVIDGGSTAYLLACLPLIYGAYHFIDPVVSSTPTYKTEKETDEETNDEPAQMSLLNEAEPIQMHEDEPIQIHEDEKIAEDIAENVSEKAIEEEPKQIEPKQDIKQEKDNQNKNKNNDKNASKLIATIIVVVIIFLFLKKCNDTLDYLITPSNEVYNTSQEWLDKDSMVKAALQTIAIESIKEAERVEIKLDYSKLEFLALNNGIDAGNNIKYKYYYICKGQYTDQSNKTIHDFAIGVGFKDDAAMKEQSPYTVLYYETK